MHVRELGHIVLNVRNLEASARFYGEVLGLRKVAVMGGNSIFYQGEGGRTHHELLIQEVSDPDAERGRLGLNHFAFKVGNSDEELKSVLDELAEKEIPVRRVVDHGGVTHSAYLEDPDGNSVELYIDVQPEHWRYDPTRTVGKGGKPLAL